MSRLGVSPRVWVVLALAIVAWSGYGVAQQRSAGAMTTAATAWLESLTPELRAKAAYPLTDEERLHWHFIPTSMFARNGVPLKDMSPAQRERAHALLTASLSQAGYEAVTSIMDLERVLLATENGSGPVRDPDLYFFTVFGTPSPTGAWALRVEGHHVSLHFAVDNSRVTVVNAPAFLGANPAEVRSGPKTGQRVLGAQEDTARALLDALTAEQRAVAVIAQRPPGDIATTTDVKVDPLSPSGLMASDMTPVQRELLMKVVDSFTANAAPDVAADRRAKIQESGVERLGFAWAGPVERGQRYYYRVQGPTFLIEHNNTQNNGNHVHSVWRDFAGDFGRDLLAEHLAAIPH